MITAARHRTLGLALLVCLPLAACGGGGGAEKQGPPGSKSNPLVATQTESTDQRSNEAAAASGKPSTLNYKSLVEKQSSKPAERFTPCSLVTANEAVSIMGRSIMPLVEAPQGPTCLYRTRHNGPMTALAMQAVPLKALKTQLHGAKRIDVSGHKAYCSSVGEPTVYVPVAGGVLSVSGQCSVAKQFAVRAVSRLTR